jgi:hypothetical protein
MVDHTGGAVAGPDLIEVTDELAGLDKPALSDREVWMAEVLVESGGAEFDPIAARTTTEPGSST